MHNVLHKRYYDLELMDNYLVQTQLQTKSSGIKLPEVHRVKKVLNTNLLPESRKRPLHLKKSPEIKQRLGQGGAGINVKDPKLLNQLMNRQTNYRKC